ncbi:motility protein A [Thermoproteota archaeon]
MDIMIILGLIVAAIAFYFGVPDLRMDLHTYLQSNSFILVFFGTVASTMLCTSLKEFRNILTVFKQLIFKPKRLEPKDAVKKLVEIAELAQRTSKQALAAEGKGIGDGFMERALGLVGAGLDKEFIRKTLETDIYEIQRRHGDLINTVRTMGTFAPMFGLTGTVLGIVQVLKNVTDIDNIVAGMSLALLTTLYGLILSALFFIPISNKLRGISAREALTKEIITEGILSIMDKEIPLKVEQYLTSYLETKLRKSEK